MQGEEGIEDGSSEAVDGFGEGGELRQNSEEQS